MKLTFAPKNSPYIVLFSSTVATQFLFSRKFLRNVLVSKFFLVVKKSRSTDVLCPVWRASAVPPAKYHPGSFSQASFDSASKAFFVLGGRISTWRFTAS